MAQPSPSSPVPAAAVSADGLPAVRLLLKHGSAPAIAHEVASISFLVGTVPGCDLRLPGAALPAVSCLITRRPDGVELRKLAPIGALLVNGHPAGSQRLNDGDRITLGTVELLVQVTEAPIPPTPIREPVVRLAPIVVDTANRAELDDTRQQLYDRYRRRRDRLAGLHQAIRRAARNLQERKQQVEGEARAVAVRREEEAVRKAILDAHAAELAQKRTALDDEQRRLALRSEELQQQHAGNLAAVEMRERKLVEDEQALVKSQAAHQAALARLDRSQAALDEREQRLRGHALEVDRRFEQLQRDTREMEEQAAQLDEWRTKLTAQGEQTAARQAEQEATTAQLAQRAAALEGQQAMLAALRTRLERLREDVRREEEQLAEVRARQEEVETDLKRRGQEVQQLRDELEAERASRTQDARRLEERSALLESAVARLRETQEGLEAQEARLREREQQFEARAAQQAEQGGLLQGAPTRSASCKIAFRRNGKRCASARRPWCNRNRRWPACRISFAAGPTKSPPGRRPRKTNVTATKRSWPLPRPVEPKSNPSEPGLRPPWRRHGRNSTAGPPSWNDTARS